MEPTRVESLIVFHSNGRLLALPANIRRGWKWRAMANSQAYYNTSAIKAIKCFKVQSPVVSFICTHAHTHTHPNTHTHTREHFIYWYFERKTDQQTDRQPEWQSDRQTEIDWSINRLSVCIYIYIYIYIYKHTRTHAHLHTHNAHMCMYICIYIPYFFISSANSWSSSTGKQRGVNYKKLFFLQFMLQRMYSQNYHK